MSTSLSTDLEVAADELRFAQLRLDQFVPKEELEQAVEAAKDNLANVATLKQCTVSSSKSKSTPTSADYSELGKSVSARIGAMTDDQFGAEEDSCTCGANAGCSTPGCKGWDEPFDEPPASGAKIVVNDPQKPSLATDLPNGHSGVWDTARNADGAPDSGWVCGFTPDPDGHSD